MKTIARLGLVISALLCVGLAPHQQAGLEPEPVMPLDVGNRWVYETTIPDLPEVQVTIDRVHEVDGELWHSATLHLMDPFNADVHEEADVVWLRHEGAGLEMADLFIDEVDDEHEIYERFTLLPYPAAPGDTFELDEDVKMRVVAIDRSVEVESGEFTCVLYELIPHADRAHEEDIARLWVAPGIGLIRAEVVEGDLETIVELVDYELIEE